MSSLGLGLAVATPLLLLGCGPYSEVGQKLDVALTFATAETFVAASGTEARILVLGRDAGGAPSGFALSALELPQAAGLSGRTYEGSWSENGQGLDLQVQLDYEMPDERGEDLLSRLGSTRTSVDRTLAFTTVRSGDTLTLTGDPAWAGTYLLLTDALGQLGSATAADVGCQFLVANLAVLTSQIRIIGFGGPGMLQYSTAFTYVGTLAGGVKVGLTGGLLSPKTTITYSAFSDFSGVTLAGNQITFANAGGNGHMEGTVAFTFAPTVNGIPGAEETGTILYGQPGGGGDAIQIGDGYVSGGEYVVTLWNGVSATVDPVAPPATSLAACLGLP